MLPEALFYSIQRQSQSSILPESHAEGGILPVSTVQDVGIWPFITIWLGDHSNNERASPLPFSESLAAPQMYTYFCALFLVLHQTNKTFSATGLAMAYHKPWLENLLHALSRWEKKRISQISTQFKKQKFLLAKRK